MLNIKKISLKFAMIITLISLGYLGVEKFDEFSWNQNCRNQPTNGTEFCNGISQRGIKLQYYWITFMIYAVPADILLGLIGTVVQPKKLL